MIELSYTFDALFSAVRITITFIVLFLVIAPLFLKHTRDLPPIERMIYSWVGLSGVIMVVVFVLSELHLFDLISLILSLVLIPIVQNIWKSREQGIVEFFQNFELRTVVSHVRFIEQKKRFGIESVKKKLKAFKPEFDDDTAQTWLVIVIALSGAVTRMIPALQNASPFSRLWYEQLNRIKNIRLQDYFSGYPDPGGMHSLVSVFSMITQVSPELILHLLGALISFFLCVIIYWATKDITRNEYPLAPIFALSIYALAPMLFLPLSLDQQIEANSLDLALCFAIPTITIFIRNVRGSYKSPWFYILSGFVATAMTDLFVAFIILLPSMLIGLLALPRRRYFRSLVKVLGYLTTISLVALSPYLIYLGIYEIDILFYFREQFFDTKAYSYYPLLITDLENLSRIYLFSAVILIAGMIIEYFLSKKFRDEVVFLFVFCLISLIYLPAVKFELAWIDPDQLNGFYALLISISFGIAIASLLRVINWLIRYKKTAIHWLERGMLIGGIIGLLYLQGGIQISRVLPTTLPNGFFSAYYQIIDERLPYTYATVGPDIDRSLAKNRHYFMNYDFFLDQYGKIDSLYHEWLQVPPDQRELQQIPPASIFIFVENPPYGSIQQGILYDPGRIMRDVEQWISNFKNLEDRNIRIYYSAADATVYEVINRKGESAINDILFHIRPNKEQETD